MRHLITFGLCLLLLAGLTFAGSINGVDAVTTNLPNILHAPSTTYWFGADSLGRDILSRLAGGLKISFTVALGVWALSFSLGVICGLFAGWFGGWWDKTLMRVADVVLAFPGILLALALASLMRPGLSTIVLALGLTGWVTFARLTRVQVQNIKHHAHIQAGLLCGSTTPRLWLKNVLPNIAGPLIVESIFTLCAAIVAEAGLSFLGIGIAPPTPSLGAMIREGTQYLLIAPHLVIAPGATLLVLIIALTELGEFIRHALNPHRFRR